MPGTQFERREAEAFNAQSGVKMIRLSNTGEIYGLGDITNGDWSRYDGIELGKSAELFTFNIRVSADNDVATIVLRITSPTGTILRTIPVSSTGGFDQYKTISTTLNRVRGVQTLYLTYVGGSGKLLNIDWFGWTPAVVFGAQNGKVKG